MEKVDYRDCGLFPRGSGICCFCTSRNAMGFQVIFMTIQARKRAKEHFRQAIKTGVAGLLSMVLAEFFGLPEGYWAVISAVIVMQSNIGAAVSAAWSRLAGTAIGAFVGALFVALWGVNAAAFGVAVTLTVLICAFLGLLDSYRLASATVAIVMLFGRPDVSWTVALHRFTEVSLGVVVALLVTVFIWPSRARKKLHNGIADALSFLYSLYDAVIRRYRGEDAPVEELRARMAKVLQSNEKLQVQTLYEPRLGMERKELLMLLMEHVHRILHAVDALETVTHGGAGGTLREKYEPELGELIERIGAAIQRLCEEVTAWRFSMPGDDLPCAISALEEKTTAIRKARLTATHDLEEILHYYSQFHALRNLAREIDLARETGGRWISSEE